MLCNTFHRSLIKTQTQTKMHWSVYVYRDLRLYIFYTLELVVLLYVSAVTAYIVSLVLYVQTCDNVINVRIMQFCLPWIQLPKSGVWQCSTAHPACVLLLYLPHTVGLGTRSCTMCPNSGCFGFLFVATNCHVR